MNSTVEIDGGAVERSPMSGKINDLRRVRVEITLLNSKEDFAATRTCGRARRMPWEGGGAAVGRRWS
jgi:hypothetical protein